MAARGRLIWLALMLGLTLHAADDGVTAWIEQLQHEDFEIRRTAIEKLEKEGEAARAALEAALPAADPETRRTLADLIKKLDFSTVRLVAFDRDGNPAPGIEANVQLYETNSANDWTERRTFTTTFDPTGRSLLEDKFNLRAWMNLTFTNWTVAGHQAQFNLELERGENQIPLLAQRPGKITFLALGAEGKPLKDVQLKLVGNTRLDPELLELQLKMMESWGGFGGTRQLAGSTGEDGKVVIENIPEGVYTVIARCEGHAPQLLAGVRIRENDNVTAAPLQLTPRKTGKVTVTLIGLDGKPGKPNEVHCTLEPLFDTPLDPAKARRMRQMLLQMRWNGDRPQPDEKGKIEFKDVPAGKYRLLAFMNNQPRNVDLVEVKGDDSVDAGTLRSVSPGGISGKIIDQNGKGIPNVTVGIVRRAELDLEIADGTLNVPRVRQSISAYGSAQTNHNGTYDIKNLPADDYVALIQYSNRHSAIFDLQVPADRSITAPLLTMTSVEKQQSQETKGRILLADGSPAAGATILLMMGYGSSSTYADDKGNFRYPYYGENQYTQLIAVAHKHRPKLVDLTAPDVKLSEITVTLEKQNYGSLLVNVVDEAGQPLSGVSVETVQGQGRYYYRFGRQNSKVRTDQFGQARLSGLYAGDRKLAVTKRGYVTKEEVVAKINPDEETELKIVLRDALELSGTVELPADYKHTDVFASLTGPVSAMRKVDGGKFSFRRLPAGDYEVGILAPGLLTPEKQKITLKADQPPPQDIKVSADKPGALIAEVPARYQGYMVAIAPANDWNPETNGELEKRAYRWSTHHVDKDGRFEQFGVKPGKFDLYLIPPPDQQRYYYDGQRNQTRVVSALQIVPGVETVTLENVAALKTAPARKFPVESGTAAVSGGILFENPKTLTNSQLYLVLAGPNAYAATQWQVPGEFMRAPLLEPILINAPPNLKVSGASASSTGFRFESVPPGEYTIYAKLFMYNNADFNKLSKPVKLAAVTVKQPDEQIDLGEIKFAVPAELLDKQKPPQKIVETEYASDEGVSSFKP